MTYGPIGAFLAEFFPSRIRYTSVSVPYHIGNGWGGGLVPIVTTSMYLSTGSVGYALIYPIVVPAVMFLIAIFVMPETRKHSIWEEGAIEASRSRASGATGSSRPPAGAPWSPRPDRHGIGPGVRTIEEPSGHSRRRWI